MVFNTIKTKVISFDLPKTLQTHSNLARPKVLVRTKSGHTAITSLWNPRSIKRTYYYYCCTNCSSARTRIQWSIGSKQIARAQIFKMWQLPEKTAAQGYILYECLWINVVFHDIGKKIHDNCNFSMSSFHFLPRVS